MTYVIYDKATTRIVGKQTGYKTHAAAQAQLTRLGKGLIEDETHPKFRYGIAEAKYFRENIQKTVTKTNMMTGVEYEESVNTPLHLSPASETYWSM